MSKTPYEIRHELLMLAQSILSEQNMNERVRLENTWNMKCEQLRFNAERHSTPLVFPEFPDVSQYDVEEVIKLAEKLNKFVSSN